MMICVWGCLDWATMDKTGLDRENVMAKKEK